MPGELPSDGDNEATGGDEDITSPTFTTEAKKKPAMMTCLGPAVTSFA
jgi:hypothetical protein